MQPVVMPRLSAEEQAAARAIFEGKAEGKTACHFCAGIHATVANLPPSRQPCPRIKRIEWHPDGTVLVLEYHHPGDWADENTIFPHDVYDAEDTDA
jgi:hypothetical protein